MLRQHRLFQAGFDKWVKLQVQVARQIRNYGVNKEFYSGVLKAKAMYQHVLHQLKFQQVTLHVRHLGEFKVLHQRKIDQLVTHLEQATSTKSEERDKVLDSGAMVNSVDPNKTALATSEKVEEVTLVAGVHGDVKEITHKGRWDLQTEKPHVKMSLNNTLQIPGSI